MNAGPQPGSTAAGPRRGAALLVTAAVASALGNLAFQVLVGRRGGVASYGAIGSLLSIGTVAAVISAGIQFAVARLASLDDSAPVDLVRRAVWAAFPWFALGLGTSLLAFAAALLGARDALSMALAALYATGVVAYSVPAGILIGRRRFGTLAAVIVVGVVVRMSLGVLIDRGRGTATEAALVSALTSACVAVAMVLSLIAPSRHAPHLASRAPVAGGLTAEFVHGGLLAAGVWGTWILPMAFAQVWLSPVVAGNLAAVHLLVTGILFATSAVVTAFFPELASSRRPTVVTSGLVATVAVAGAAVVSSVLVGPGVVHLLYGSEYGASWVLFLTLGTSVTLVAVANYLVWASRAVRPDGVGLGGGVLISLLIEIGLGLAWHPSGLVLAIEPGIAVAAGATVTAVAAWQRQWQESGGHHAAHLVHQVPHIGGAIRVRRNTGVLPRTAVGVMAHNEGATIRRCLEAILAEESHGEGVASVIVVASACTDNTVEVAEAVARETPRVRVLVEPERSGKAGAMNLFLRSTTEPICVFIGADLLPAPGGLVALTEPFEDDGVGMTGARVVPVNPERGVVGRVVHTLWRLHDEVSRRQPKLGEAVAVRRVFDTIDTSTLTDEVSIEALVQAAGLELRYVPESVVFNHGPTHLRDYLAQRRRIHRGHLRVRRQTGYAAATLDSSGLVRACASGLRRRPSSALPLAAAVLLEMTARVGARIDHEVQWSMEHGVWEPITSAKRSFAVTYEMMGAPVRAHRVTGATGVEETVG